ncbi:MAG: N-acetylglucosamine kinase [bacterium]
MYYLGVDGGGTKTAFILINERGKILSYYKGASCHYLENGLDTYRQVLGKGIEKVCDKAEIKKNAITYSFLGIPCYGEVKEDTPVLEEIVREILNSDAFECGNDVKAGWAGSLACRSGINIVAGTGAIGFGIDENGNSARASGWDYFCGDEGSGYWLGKKLLSLFTKEADGRVQKTPLYDIVRKELEIKNDFELISVVYEELERKRDKIAELAFLLDKAADKGDEKVLDIFDEAAYEHSLTVKAIINKLDFSGEKKISVSYSGGVFNIGSYILNPFRKYLESERVKLSKPILKPVTGAALYAIEISEGIKPDERLISRLKEEEKKFGI